jgi:restriction system protein
MGRKQDKRIGSRFLKYLIPLHEVLKEMGGSATSSEATDLVIEKCTISEEEQRKTLKNGTSQVRNDIAWARLYLVKANLMDNAQRGVWRLTDLGLKTQLKPGDELKIFDAARDTLNQTIASDEKKDIELDSLDENDIATVDSEDNFKDQLIKTLCSLSPYGFEKICRRVLQDSGFEEVQVTRQSRDGGIDGFGTLRINKNQFVSEKICFQCKRYTGKSIGPDEIREFQGAMLGRANKGIFITTSWFTTEAKKESKRDGAPPIELIDADKLVEIFISLKLGVRPAYEVDVDFFKLFAK